MLAKRIIPCLDVKNGRVVKGIHFRNLQDAGDPVETAKFYSGQCADEIIFLDITATIENRKTTYDIVRKTAENVFIPLTVGGGIKNLDDITKLLSSGADKVSINSAAVNTPGIITESSKMFGSQCIVVAIDAKRVKPGKWEIYINSGNKPTGLDAVCWSKKVEQLGAGEILLTSMDRDGTKLGFDLELTRKISQAVKIPIIASGGIGNLKDFVNGFKEGKADAALAASIFHYEEYSVKEVKEYLRKNGLIVRED